MLGRLAERRAAGLCSLAQAEAITKAGIDTRALTFARAAELCAMLRHGNWRSSGLRSTPEWIAVHRSETRPEFAGVG